MVNIYNSSIIHMPCPYKNLFGEPGTGIHSYRIFDIAYLDVFVTVVFAYVIYLFVPQYKFVYVLLSVFVLGIFIHRVFCVRTTVDKLLFDRIPQ